MRRVLTYRLDGRQRRRVVCLQDFPEVLELRFFLTRKGVDLMELVVSFVIDELRLIGATDIREAIGHATGLKRKKRQGRRTRSWSTRHTQAVAA